MNVGQRLKKLRLERGMTQSELGKILGMTKGAIHKYESGQIKNFKPEALKELTELFGLPPAFFIFDEVPNMGENLEESIVKYVGSWFSIFVDDLRSLNLEGQAKVHEYCNDLAQIPKYQKEVSENG